MLCDLCGRTNGHIKGCPYYEPEKSDHYCPICGDGIYEDDEYVENPDGEQVHYDCVTNLRWFIDWLGLKVERK